MDGRTHTAIMATDMLLYKGQRLAQKLGESSAIYLSCKMFRELAIINIRE